MVMCFCMLIIQGRMRWKMNNNTERPVIESKRLEWRKPIQRIQSQTLIRVWMILIL
uniref:Uncharacterized protein n=1 Tax=Brassica oleracea TaxID=3712 RepID=A0A3P6D8E9_BRAOL|nr:unnamed protein product [Brassica oleracea]